MSVSVDIPQEQLDKIIERKFGGRSIEDIAKELHATQVKLAEASKVEGILNATKGEVKRLGQSNDALKAKLEQTEEKNASLASELDAAKVELKHVQAEGDRLAGILRQASEDADALVERAKS